VRLAALLAQLTSEELDRLATEHLRGDTLPSRGALCDTLEGILRSYAFVQACVFTRQPPTFSLLVRLLEADGHAVVSSSLKDVVSADTAELCRSVQEGTLLDRDEQLRVYRKVLAEARRTDVDIDVSEAAILAVLRRELGVRQVEHFLLEHHSELQAFWNTGHGFLHEMHALRSVGLIFANGGSIVLAEEMVPLIRRSLGLEMTRGDARRLLSGLSNAELSQALERARLKTGGNKEERLERLLSNWIQPSEVLDAVGLPSLRELAKTNGAKNAGNKEELIERLVNHFARGQDQVPEELGAPDPPPEARALEELRFRALFDQLRGNELTDVLRRIESSRQTGSKEQKITALWGSRFSEHSLLMCLTNRALEELLDRLRLRLSGSKRERVDRIVDHFRTTPIELLKALGHVDEIAEPDGAANEPSMDADSPPSDSNQVEPS
jgi:hypothetical protein